MIIGIDFDGTCVTHEYPQVGKDIGAEKILKRLINNGHQLILWTMRSGKELEDAINWFKEKDIPLWGINQNPEQNWTTSPKAYCELYIDDAALGCPLEKNPLLFKEQDFLDKYGYSPFLSPEQPDGFCRYNYPREYVSWFGVEMRLEAMGII